ncbi:MAG: membrane dipeptidase [Candidatus Ratteibacteria bacterium]
MNARMQGYRDHALSILKPTQKEIAHGFALHTDSVVWDSYGFAPTAAIDGTLLKSAIESGASPVELSDMVEEMGMTGMVKHPADQKEYFEAWEVSGVTCVFQNTGQEGNRIDRLVKRHARFTWTTDILRNKVSRAVCPEDVLLAKSSGRHCLYFTGNGVPMLEEWNTVEEELRYIRVWFQLGCRMMHLTYNRRNMLGDGCAEPDDAGLSDFGRRVIEEMNRIGVIVDVAHSGLKSSLEAAKASSRPMVASHSTCRTLREHCRAKSDEVIRAIADTGGYIGITCVPAFLGRTGDIAALLDHIDYVVKIVGVDHVAIGTDHGYGSSRASEEWAKVPSHNWGRSRWSGFWPKNDPLFDKEWNDPMKEESLAWTNWPLFTVGLVQRGYSDDDIRKIIGGNVMRVCRDVLTGTEFGFANALSV